jgi:hypothetical protein
MANSKPELIELTRSDDPGDVAYPPILCALENQLLAARYLDDELIEECIAQCQKLDQRERPYRPEELPPVLRRYLELCRRGVRNSHMRVNGRKLRAYTTAKRDDVIATLFGGAAELESRGVVIDPVEKMPPLELALRNASQILKMKPKSVLRRWAEINPKKPGRGRPRKKITK